MQDTITRKLTHGLDCHFLEVINESHTHNVPAGSESHFKVVVVSDDFKDVSLINRHRRINDILSEELKQFIHALSMHTYTIEEWRVRHSESPDSPNCRGGKKNHE